MSLCILDADGQAVVHDTIAASPDAFLRVITPFRDSLAVACDSSERVESCVTRREKKHG